MPGIGGLGVADNLLANNAALNLNRTQAGLQRSMTRLSSGLRINTAADDPSGLSIAEKLTSQVNGFDQGSRNVQDANNAATVAEGALSTIKTILQRMRQLAVEASSDMLSQDDRASLQDEANQLLLEINRIAQNTTFNGTQLLDGSHAGYQPGQTASATIESNATLSGAGSVQNGGQLVTVAAVGDGPATQESQISIAITQNALGTGQPETVTATNLAYVQPGQVFTSGGAMVTVDAVDVGSGTLTATFSAPVASGSTLHGYVLGNSTNAVAAGLSVMNVSSGIGDAGVPLYGGEVLQIDPFGTNDVVKVIKVLSPTSFLANFASAHGAGAQVYSFNGWFIGSGSPQTATINFGTATDPPPAGSEAWVEEASSFYPESNNVTIAGTGTVLSTTPTTESVYIPNITNAFGGTFAVQTTLGSPTGLSSVPPNDGTVELQVVDNNGTAAVQESYYDTASQTTVVSPYFLSANERGMLEDGVVTQIGNITLNDVGLSAYIKVLQATSPLTGTQNGALAIQGGPEEGSQIQVGIAAMNTGALRISNTNLMSSLNAEDAIGQIDYALDQTTSQSATIGAIIVRLGEEGENNNIASVNLASSESNIMDLNVPQETTAYTKLQVLGQVGTSVLAQANTNAQSVLALFR